jgi:PAS domain S-box-containing protein
MGWWRWTPATRQLEWSEEMGPLYGKPRGWMSPTHDGMTLVHPDDVARVRADVARVMAEGGGSLPAWRVPLDDGSERWLDGELVVERDASGAVLVIAGMVRDVTEVLAADTHARRAEDFLRTALDAMADGVLVRVAGEAQAAFANRAAAEILGVSDDEILLPYGEASRWSLRDTLGRDVSPADVVSAHALATGSSETAYYHLYRPDGLWRWIQARAVPFTLGVTGRRAVMVSFTDLTNLRTLQRRTEQQSDDLAARNAELAARTLALSESEARLRVILTSMHEGVVVRSEDGRILLSNPAAERILGREPGWLSGQRDHEFADNLLAADGSRLEVTAHPALVALLSGQPVENFVMGVQRHTSELRWLRVNAIPLFREGEARAHAVVSTFSDVTPLREAEQALAERESHYRLMATGIRDVVSLTDTHGVFEWVSPSVTSMLGWTPDALIGTVALALLHPEDAQRADRMPIAETLRSAGTPLPVQFRLRTATGGYIWTETTLTAVRDETGVITGHLRVTRDVTERRAMEQQLSQTERLRAVGTLAGGLAHDFNNVLTVVRTTAEHLLDAAADPAVAGDLRTILQASDRAQSLTRQMLTFARRQVRVPTVCIVDDVLTANAALFATLLRTPGQLQFELGAPGACIRIDPDELTTAVMNLLTNARDALPAGGTVVIRTATHCDASSASIDLAPTPHLSLTVQDSGLGMPEEVRQRAFEPFFTTKPVGEGTGLGLATVHGVCKANGGTVRIDSAPGQGTAVSLWLPLLPASTIAEPSPSDDATTAPVATRSLRLLVVDDEPPLRAVMARLARRAGHTVVEAPSGTDALRLLEAEGETFDAIVSDQLMPGLSGRQLMNVVHERWPHIRCAMVSGYTAEDDVAALVDGGRNLFLEKPFTTAGFDGLLLQLSEPSAFASA